MNPHTLKLANFRTWADLEYHFPEGCLAIVGPNGAGKSSLLMAVELALFGSRSFGAEHSWSAFEDAMTVELTFEHRGEIYRVRRTYSPRGRGSTKLDFERASSPSDASLWTPLTRESTSQTQALIEQTIGLSRQTFRASVYSAQGDSGAFCSATGAKMMEILSDALALDLWDDILGLVRDRKRGVEGDLAALRGTVEAAEAELSERSRIEGERDATLDEQRELDANLATAENDVAAIDERLQAARETAATRESAEKLAASREVAHREAEARVSRIQSALDGRELLLAAGDGARMLAEREPDLEQELAETLALKERKAEYDRLNTEEERLIRELEAIADKANALRSLAHDLSDADDGAETCTHCGQTLGAEARQRAIQSYTTEADETAAKGAALAESLEGLTPKLRAARDAWQDHMNAGRPIDVIQNELRHVRASATTIAECNAKLAQLDELERELSSIDLDRLRRDAEQARREADKLAGGENVAVLANQRVDLTRDVARRREAVAAAAATLARLDERLARLDKVKEQLAHARMDEKLRSDELDVWLALEKECSRDGVPVLVVENVAIPQMENEAMRVLAELGRPYSVEIRTQRELKSRDGLRDELELLVDGNPYSSYSGGEQWRIDIALRIALSKLLAHRRGADVRMLAIDEPDGLDEDGRAQLPALLHSLLGDMPKVVLISHQPDLSEGFDQVLRLEREEGEPSRIVEGAAREAVPA